MCKKYSIWTPVTCRCENEKYLASVIDDSVITCDEIIDETKTVSTNFNNKKLTYIKKNFLYFTFVAINYYTIIVNC